MYQTNSPLWLINRPCKASNPGTKSFLSTILGLTKTGVNGYTSQDILNSMKQVCVSVCIILTCGAAGIFGTA